MIAEFGSYFVGGEITNVTGQASREVRVTDYLTVEVEENGDYVTQQAYVQFFVPSRRNALPPVVLIHGGGLCGSVWESTPDGRKGWLHDLLGRGYEVHVMDNVERGRAGWSPYVTPTAPLSRSLQGSWQQFRIGPAEGYPNQPFAVQNFPHEDIFEAARFFVPRWTSQKTAQTHAVTELLQKLGTSIVVCHSHGAEAAFGACETLPKSVAHLVALEPVAFPSDRSALSRVPLTLVQGGNLDCDPYWRGLRDKWLELVSDLQANEATAALLDLDQLRVGASHMMMQDRNSQQVLEHLFAQVEHSLAVSTASPEI